MCYLGARHQVSIRKVFEETAASIRSPCVSEINSDEDVRMMIAQVVSPGTLDDTNKDITETKSDTQPSCYVVAIINTR